MSDKLAALSPANDVEEALACEAAQRNGGFDRVCQTESSKAAYALFPSASENWYLLTMLANVPSKCELERVRQEDRFCE